MGERRQKLPAKGSPTNRETGVQTILATVETQQLIIVAIHESLRFRDQDHRLATIERAQESTFGWIFDKRELGFVDWMLNGYGVYWIRGKPGSGKSTLMKFLHDNDRFRQLLQSRVANERKFDVWFFFNDRGTYLQKTLEGLLRGLLLELASHNRQLETLISDIYYAQPRETRGQWSMNDINQAFAAVMMQDIIDMEVTIFLDALDEYHGFPEVISQWILDRINTSKTEGSRTKFRFCFSSRLWDSFVRAFDHEAGFLLHEQTTQDIRRYVTSRLIDMKPAILSLPSSLRRWPFDIPPASVVDMISKKAEGVFLWVKLAVDELAFLPVTASLEDFERRIKHLPKELETFYERTISRIPEHSRQQAFVFLELLSRSLYLLSPRHMMEAEACAQGSTFAECRELLASFHARVAPSEEGIDEQSNRLLNLCGGLLECVISDGVSIVQFIHRTVRDFVSSPGFPQLILGQINTLPSENGYTFLLKHRCVSNIQNPDEVILRLAHADETSTGRALSTFLDSLPESFFDAQGHSLRSTFYTSPFILGVAADLRLYVQRCLQVSKASSFGKAVPPLNVLARDVAARAIQIEVDEGNTPKTAIDLTQMTELLLANGMSIKDEYFALTPFETLFFHCYESSCGRIGSDISPEMINVAQTLIVKGGQDPSELLRSKFQDSAGKRATIDRKESQLRSALHVSYGDMAEMLLKNGADPNIQDDKGNTALDVCIGTEKNIYEIVYHGQPEEVVDTTFMLIRYGGQLSKRGAKTRPVFLKLLEERFPNLSSLDKLRSLPVLSAPVRTNDVYEEHSEVDATTASKLSRMKQKAKRFTRLPQRFRSSEIRRQ